MDDEALEQSMMNIDTKMVDMEKAAFNTGKKVFMAAPMQMKLIMVLIAIVVICYVLWWVGNKIAGFMASTGGILLIILSILAILVYFIMRAKGVGFKSAAGGLATVLMGLMLFIVYIGMLDSITGLVLKLAPLIIFGAVAFFGYKAYQGAKDKYTAQGIMAMVLAFCIAVPLYQAVVIPYTVGTPVELTVDVARDGTGDWVCYVELHEFMITSTMTTQFNPYLIGMVEASNWMWTDIDTTEEAYVDINIQIESDRTLIYYEKNHIVRVGVNDMETIWGVVHIPSEYLQYINVQIRMTAQVHTISGEVLATASGVYTH